jgi:hypothetical protein
MELIEKVGVSLKETQKRLTEHVISYCREHAPLHKFVSWQQLRELRSGLFELKKEFDGSMLFVKWVKREGASLRDEGCVYDQEMIVEEKFEMSNRSCAPGRHIVPLECALGYAVQENVLHRGRSDLSLLVCSIADKVKPTFVTKTDTTLFSKLRVS